MKRREWLIAYRNAKGLTQQDVADALGIPQTTYASYEVGIRAPKPKTAKKIAKVLKFDWTKFYE